MDSREPVDLVVVGAGISGLSLAWLAAREGQRVRVLERDARVGGCIHSERPGSLPGYWFELGAHTAYNSYGAFLDVVVGAGLGEKLIPRGPSRARFGWLKAGLYRWLTPFKVLLQLNWFELLLHAPVGLFRSKRGRTMSEQFRGLVGPGNYKNVLKPFLSAVPSQSPDEFPAEGPGSLFKKRPRREEFLRSFGFEGGLQTVCDAAATSANVEVETGVVVSAIKPASDGFVVELEGRTEVRARKVAIAAPLGMASTLLRDEFPEVANALAGLQTVSLDSVGVVLPREKCWMPECAFVVPARDSFYSCVTRDPFPDARYRAFALHFRAGLSRDERLARMCEVLKVEPTDFLHLAEKHVTLPSPQREHAAQVAAIDRALQGRALALTGNYFNGLAIEDCVLRSNAEWQRIRGSP